MKKDKFDFQNEQDYKDTFLTDVERLQEYGNEFPRAYNFAREQILGWPMPPKFAEATPKQIQDFCQNFWIALPDSQSIRHGFFFDLCDYCSEWLCWASSRRNRSNV